MAVPLNPLVADYYRTHSSYSDPGALVGTYADLPADPGLLAGVARSLLVHRQEGGLFDHVMAEDRLHDDAEVRYVEEILRLIVERDGSSLLEPREVGDRFVGVCRDFVLLHCSFLRHAGIPARMRCGFADYFDPSDPLRELYDHVAEIAGDEVDYDATRALYARDERLRVPGSVWSLAPFNGPGQVVLREAPPA